MRDLKLKAEQAIKYVLLCFLGLLGLATYRHEELYISYLLVVAGGLVIQLFLLNKIKREFFIAQFVVTTLIVLLNSLHLQEKILLASSSAKNELAMIQSDSVANYAEEGFWIHRVESTSMMLLTTGNYLKIDNTMKSPRIYIPFRSSFWGTWIITNDSSTFSRNGYFVNEGWYASHFDSFFIELECGTE